MLQGSATGQCYRAVLQGNVTGQCYRAVLQGSVTMQCNSATVLGSIQLFRKDKSLALVCVFVCHQKSKLLLLRIDKDIKL